MAAQLSYGAVNQNAAATQGAYIQGGRTGSSRGAGLSQMMIPGVGLEVSQSVSAVDDIVNHRLD